MSKLTPDQFSGEVLTKALTYCQDAFKSSGAYSGCIEKILERASQIQFEELMKSAPEVGTYWDHHGGNQYLVLLVTNAYSTSPEYVPTVVYKGANGKNWSRPLSDWHRSMTEVGKS